MGEHHIASTSKVWDAPPPSGKGGKGGKGGEGGKGGTGLARYVVAAALARTADGGAVVAVVLLVTSSGGSGTLAGVLGACITAPHLLGPFVARPLDTEFRSRSGENITAAYPDLHGLGAVLRGV
ncbi:hypothetical protein AB0I50_45520, partial [Streptomyces prunicolor]